MEKDATASGTKCNRDKSEKRGKERRQSTDMLSEEQSTSGNTWGEISAQCFAIKSIFYLNRGGK